MGKFNPKYSFFTPEHLGSNHNPWKGGDLCLGEVGNESGAGKEEFLFNPHFKKQITVHFKT